MAAMQRPLFHVNDSLTTTSGRGSSIAGGASSGSALGGFSGGAGQHKKRGGDRRAPGQNASRPPRVAGKGLTKNPTVGGGVGGGGSCREGNMYEKSENVAGGGGDGISPASAAAAFIGGEHGVSTAVLNAWPVDDDGISSVSASCFDDFRGNSGVGRRRVVGCGGVLRSGARSSRAGCGNSSFSLTTTTTTAAAAGATARSSTGIASISSRYTRASRLRRGGRLITRASNGEDGAVKERSKRSKKVVSSSSSSPSASSAEEEDEDDDDDDDVDSPAIVDFDFEIMDEAANSEDEENEEVDGDEADFSDLALVEIDPTPPEATVVTTKSERKPPTKGVDLLRIDDYLSPALAQKMARNGHLSALNTGVSSSSSSSPPTSTSSSPAKAAKGSKSSSSKKEGKKKLDAVLYSSEALGNDSPPVVFDFSYAEKPTPVFVMLPLDVVTRDGSLQHVKALDVSLRTLKKIGVEGVMIDVWWGIVEREGPGLYDWRAYTQLLEMVRDAGLKLNAVMSFHACGANVGDYFEVKLPQWVLEAARDDPDLFFTDQYGYRNPECISLWADNSKTLMGRTPLECYREFMQSFRDEVEDCGLMSTLSEISVGCGPCGELRYPAYPENKISPNSSQWQFPGIGEFQCYDQRALGNLARAGSEAGHIEWGGAGPHDAGGYNNLPHETGFFRAHQGSWDTEYGQFFLSWYSGELVEHGDRMLRCAREVFKAPAGGSSSSSSSSSSSRGRRDEDEDDDDDDEDPGAHIQVAIKCAGVHWWYNSRSHAAELTAGYFNTRSGDNVPERDGYEPIVKICGKHQARLNFTCTEMRDIEHPYFSRCGPEGLLRQIRAAAARHGVKVAGENALCRFDQDAYDKIITNCRGEGTEQDLWESGALLPPMASFTFLRLTKELFEDDNFNSFVHFVGRMANETGVGVKRSERRQVVQADEVLEELLPAGNIMSLEDIRGETSSGFVSAQFSDL